MVGIQLIIANMYGLVKTAKRHNCCGFVLLTTRVMKPGSMKCSQEAQNQLVVVTDIYFHKAAFL